VGLSGALELLAKQGRITVSVEGRPEIEDAGHFRIQLEGVSLAAALTLLTEQFGLTWVIKDGAVNIIGK
jgi:hypothetical protein